MNSRRTLWRWSTAFTVMFVCLVGRAEAAPLPTDATAQVIRLRDAVAAARQQVPSVLAALAGVRAAEGRAWLARTTLSPAASMRITAGGTVQNTEMAGQELAACGAASAVCQTGSGFSGTAYGDATVSASWTLWDFGRTGLLVRAANISTDAAKSDVLVAERVATATAATAYYGLLADQEAVTASIQILQQRERQLEIARHRVSAGTNAPIDGTRAAIAVQTARLDLATAEGTVERDAASLAAALAMDPTVPLRGITPPEIPVDDDPIRAADLALAHAPEIVASRARYHAALASNAASRAGWRPSLVSTLSASARRTAGNGISYMDTEGASGTIGLSLPLFDPTLNPNTSIADANARSAQADLRKQELQVRMDAVQAAIAARSARQQVELAARNVTLNAANLELNETRYAAGTAPLIDLVDAQAQDAAARLTVIQRQFQWERAKVSLLASTGRLDELERE